MKVKRVVASSWGIIHSFFKVVSQYVKAIILDEKVEGRNVASSWGIIHSFFKVVPRYVRAAILDKKSAIGIDRGKRYV